MEEFRDIPGYEGLYQVSNLGNVKSLDILHIDSSGRQRLFKSKIKKQPIGNHGYRVVGLMKNKKSMTQTVHKLVASAFLNSNLEGHVLEINHIDNNKLNNSLSNLEVLTNVQHKSKSTRVLLTPEEKERRRFESGREWRMKNKPKSTRVLLTPEERERRRLESGRRWARKNRQKKNNNNRCTYDI